MMSMIAKEITMIENNSDTFDGNKDNIIITLSTILIQY